MRYLVIFSLLAALLAACGGAPLYASEPIPTLMPGDAERGTALFTQSVNGAPSCSMCHSLDESTLVGPGLKGYAVRAAAHAGESTVEEYTHISIVQPNAYLVNGFGNIMFAQYKQLLSPQEIADLVAYLLTL
ncbi:MAG: c-type cytochrome [Anaerolineae bacterium]|nr:c-type cytochrome [Anaerolineae bacterium]